MSAVFPLTDTDSSCSYMNKYLFPQRYPDFQLQNKMRSWPIYFVCTLLRKALGTNAGLMLWVSIQSDNKFPLTQLFNSRQVFCYLAKVIKRILRLSPGKGDNHRSIRRKNRQWYYDDDHHHHDKKRWVFLRWVALIYDEKPSVFLWKRFF